MSRLATIVTVILSVATPSRGWATVLICENEQHSATKLHVRVPDADYLSFVKLIESGAILPVKDPFTYNGGVNSDESRFWALSNKAHTISLLVDYMKASREFVFWIQTCGTNESWKPYWRALVDRAQMVPSAKTYERPMVDG